jgi:hypothetical protein
MECIGVGSMTTPTQIILDINCSNILLTLVIQSVRAIVELCLFVLLCTKLLTRLHDIALLM